MPDNLCPFTAADQSAVGAGQTWVRNPARTAYVPGAAGGGGGGGSDTGLALGSMMATPLGGATPSASAFAWKGAGFITVATMTAVGVQAMLDYVAGATYQGAILTLDGSSAIATISKTETVTAPAGVAGLGMLVLRFTTPPSITAGATYYAVVGRTDSTGTYALPLYNAATGATLAANIPGKYNGSTARFAAAAPAVGAVSSSSAGSMATSPLLAFA